MLASVLVEKCLTRYALTGTVLATTLGEKLGLIKFKHPLHDVADEHGVYGYKRFSPVFLADYATADDGTGIVHSSPAYGVEDFNSCVANGIAYDAELDRLFVTGKYWPRLYEIDVKPKGVAR